jgi:hypothetical protein
MFKVADVVVIDPQEFSMSGVVESIERYEDETVYMVRSPYSGNLYSRVADELAMATPERAGQVRRDMAYMEVANSACAVVRVCVDGAVITQGMVDAEIARAASARLVPTLAPMSIIGVNASTNMYA